MELVSLLDKYDDILGHLLQAATVFSGLSNHIQNDIIDCAATVVLNEIENEILIRYLLLLFWMKLAI